MAVIRKKIGDVFAVKLEHRKRYFQYVAIDSLQLGFDVIRAFKKTYSLDDNTSLETIVADEIEFYTHCSVKLGAKYDIWERIGNCSVIGNLDYIFRDTNDSARSSWEPPVKVSEKWYVWKLGEKKYTNIGKLSERYKNAEIGIVFTPTDIIERLSTGKYDLTYPE